MPVTKFLAHWLRLYIDFLGGTIDGGAVSARLHMPNDKPAHEVRVGTIKAAIWRNDTGNGVRFNTTFTRLYRDGNEWKSTNSFGRDDLLVVGKVADQAHSWICEQRQEESSAEDKRNTFFSPSLRLTEAFF